MRNFHPLKKEKRKTKNEENNRDKYINKERQKEYKNITRK